MGNAWQVLCSTGAFTRERDAFDYRAILKYGPALDVDGLELLFYRQWYEQIDQIAADLGASGLRFPAMHAEKSIGPALGSADPAEQTRALEKLAQNCRLAQRLGTEVLVLHLWGTPESDKQLERNLGSLGACITLAADAGMALAVETIPCVQADPLTNVRRAIGQDARARVALDTEFLAYHGQLEEALAADWLWQGQRVRHVHIKDYDGQMTDGEQRRRYLHPGEGKIDFAAFFAGLAWRGFGGNISLEATVIGPALMVDLPRLQTSLSDLRMVVAQALESQKPAAD
jgi:sugar phosphate isomerase/epimerase